MGVSWTPLLVTQRFFIHGGQSDLPVGNVTIVVQGGGHHGSHLLCQTVKYRVSGLGSGTRWTSGRVGLPVPTRLSFENHRVAGNSKYRGQTVSSGYPNPTRYPVFHLLPDPTRFSFENHRVAGNPKYRVLPEISGKPGVSGITRYIG